MCNNAFFQIQQQFSAVHFFFCKPSFHINFVLNYFLINYFYSQYTIFYKKNDIFYFLPMCTRSNLPALFKLYFPRKISFSHSTIGFYLFAKLSTYYHIFFHSIGHKTLCFCTTMLLLTPTRSLSFERHTHWPFLHVSPSSTFSFALFQQYILYLNFLFSFSF